MPDTSDRSNWPAAQEHLEGAMSTLEGFFRRRLPPGRRSEGEDLSQETLLAVVSWISRHGERGVDEPGCFVLGIARRKLCDLLRREYRARNGSRCGASVGRWVRPCAEGTPEEILIERERCQQILLAIQRLRSRERAFIHMRYFGGLSHEETCQRLGIAAAAGSRLRYRVIRKLRSNLGIVTGRCREKG